MNPNGEFEKFTMVDHDDQNYKVDYPDHETHPYGTGLVMLATYPSVDAVRFRDQIISSSNVLKWSSVYRDNIMISECSSSVWCLPSAITNEKYIIADTFLYNEKLERIRSGYIIHNRTQMRNARMKVTLKEH